MLKKAASLLKALSLGGLVIVLVLLPFWRHRVLYRRPPEAVFFALRDIILYTSDYFIIGTLGAWLLSRRLQGETPTLHIGTSAIFTPMVALLLLGLVSAFQAIDPVYALYHALRCLLLLTFFLLLANAPFVTPGLIAWVLSFTIVLQASIGGLQFVQGRSLGLQRLGEVVLNPNWPGISIVGIGEERWLRAYGLTQHPNLLGGCLMVCLLILVGYALDRPHGERWVLTAFFGLGLAGLLFTFSRAAWLGALAGGTVTMGLLSLTGARRKASWRAVVPFLIVALVVVTIFVTTYGRLLIPRLGLTNQGTEIRSVEERKVLMDGALALIYRYPFLGVGLGNFAVALYRVVPETVAAYPTYQPVHNVPLLVTAELGLLGGALWLALIIRPWVVLWQHRREIHLTGWWAGLNGALMGLSVVSLFDAYVWSAHQGALALTLVLGLWAREWKRKTLE
ncbi:MAG: O-antigen ligase family protein [Anaerolineae bacterium]